MRECNVLRVDNLNGMRVGWSCVVQHFGGRAIGFRSIAAE